MKKKIEKVGFVIKPHAPRIKELLDELSLYFKDHGISCLFEEAAAQKLQKEEGLEREKIPENVDLVVVLGGDGTLLSIAHLAAKEDVPVVGVNLGNLGFLTEVPLDEMYLTFDSLLEGEDKIISRRQMLEVVFREEAYYCLNDVVINKGALARMIQFAIWIDEKEITTSKADGLIISTPTGSTAYSMSAGGPIVQPYIPAVIIAPICPHTLTFRPMVIDSNSKIKVQLVTAGEEVTFTLDGQRGHVMDKGDVIEVERSDLELSLISSPKRNYFDLVQKKLGWG
jgi:NAD+ kinase